MTKEIDSEPTKTSFKSSQLQGADLALFVDLWLSDLELQLAASSHKTYQNAMNQVLSYWNKRKKSPIDALLIKQYVRDLKWRHCSASYIQRQLSVLRSFCSWAVDQNILPSNPASKIPLPKLSNEYRREALDYNEAVLLIENIPGKDLFSLRDLLMVSLVMRAGARLIEMYRANTDGYVRKGKIGLLYLQGKGRQADDSFVILVSDMADLMERYLALREPIPPKFPLYAFVFD